MTTGYRRESSTSATMTALMIMLAVVGMLAACGYTKQGVSQHKPQVGDCYRLTLPPEFTAISNSNPTVPCRDAHTVQVFSVGLVVGDDAQPQDRPDPHVLRGLDDKTCPVNALRDFLGAGERDAVSNVSIHAFYPTPAAWQHGDRQVACLVAVTDSQSSPDSLTVDLRDVMGTQASAPLRTCYRQQPLQDGLWSFTGEVVPCDRPHSSQDVNAWLVSPSANPARETVQEMCTPYVEQFRGAPLPADDSLVTAVVVQQRNGVYSLRCAIGGDSADGPVTGALLAGQQ